MSRDPPAPSGDSGGRRDGSGTRDGSAVGTRLSSTLVEFLIRQHRDELVRHAQTKLGAMEAWAEDLVHDVLLDLMSGKLDAGRIAAGKELPFMKRVIAFRALHVLRERGVFRELDPTLSRRRVGAWGWAWRHEARRRLGRSLKKLSKKLRRVVIWRDLQGRRTAEITDREGVERSRAATAEPGAAAPPRGP